MVMIRPFYSPGSYAGAYGGSIVIGVDSLDLTSVPTLPAVISVASFESPHRPIIQLSKETRGENSGGLTGRQREVLGLLARGKTMKEVAANLDLTPRTIAHHKYRIMDVFSIKKFYFVHS